MSNLLDTIVRDPGTPAAEHDPFAGPAIVAAVATTEPQREIWTATQVSEDASLSYNESVTLWMSGPLDLGALRASLSAVVARHEALRATFSADGLTMVVGAEPSVPVVVVDVTGRSADEVQAAWDALLTGEASERFDLLNGPVARVKVFRVGPEEHRVAFTAHHIVCDGWSTAVVVREWAALYSAQMRGEPSPLAPADTYSAYSLEQSSADRRNSAVADETFWVSQFGDGGPILELPVDRPRPPLKTYASRREDGELDAALVRDLRKLGSASRASLFAVLLSGFEVLLARLTGQDDVVVGVPAAGQSVGGHENLVGHCVNMLPLRARVDPEQPFRTMMAGTRSAVLEAYDHQQYTFGSLLRKLPLARDPSRLPLVSVVFNLDRGLGPDAMRFEGLTTSLTTNARLFENFDLFLNAVEIGGKVVLECQYNTDLFDRATVQRWLAVYECLLRSACDRPDESTGLLSVLTADDAARLDGWNRAAERPLQLGARVHELIEAQVASTPDAVAVEMEGVTLTFAQLDARANGLARRLHDAGVSRGALVGLCVDRSPDMVVGVLGILKAGGAYVPLDPAYPVDRLEFMVRDSKMRALVIQRKVRAELAIEAPQVIEIDGIEPAASIAEDERAATPEDPAYVIYTSGSTGVPKGVLVPHRAVVNLLASVREEPGMTSDDVVLAVTTLSFDIAVSEILLPLTVGAKIALASREVAADGQRLLALMHSSKATFVDATPSTWRLLLAAGWAGGEGLKAICTGEALPRDLAGELLKRCASVWNGYGPTETTVWSTFWRLRPPFQRVLIGKPVANTYLYVVDPRMQRVPVGVVGELFIGGTGVTLGYHDRDTLTKERFLPDLFRGGGARMYKTGDLVRYLPDGNLECLGRNDTQVKIRGFRIELGEIENALSQHPGVATAAALAREDRPGDVRLVGYVAAREGASPTDAELRAHLKKTLPEYMVPQIFVKLDRMPLLPNGKIDRRKLPAPQVSDRSNDQTFVAPRTPTEQMLAKLWQEILAVGRVGVEDDFFALGGHSLLASQVIARLRRDHGVEVTFRKMFEAPTVEKLASVIDAGGAVPAVREVQIARRAVVGSAPCSVSQRRMWLLEEMDAEQRLVHNLCASWRIEGKLDVATLRSALDTIVRRHDSLRTNILVDGADPVQVVHADGTIPLRIVDLTHLPEAERTAAMSADRAAEAIAPFDLATDRLLRTTLYTMGEETHLLSTVQHNIIWDGWSFDLFLRELSLLYEALSLGKPSPLESLPISYGDYAAWQRDWMAGADFQKQATFWRERLASVKYPLEIPTDRPRRGARSHGGASEGLHLPLATADALTALAREHGATLFMLVFAAYNVLLYRQTGQRELLVGTPVRARTRPELEGLIGPFVNAIALTTAVAPSMTFVDLLEHVRDVTLDAFSHQEVPLDALGDRPPMLRALFSLQDARSRPTGFGTLRVTQDHALAPVAANEIMLWAMESRADLLLMLNFSTELFDASTARRFLRELEVLLEQVLVNPRQPIATVPILPEEEREAIARAGGESTSLTLADAVGLRPGESVVVYVRGGDPAPLVSALQPLVGDGKLIGVGGDEAELRAAIASSGATAVVAAAADWKAVALASVKVDAKASPSVDAKASLAKAVVVGSPSKALVDRLFEAGAAVFTLYVPAVLGRPVGVRTVVRGEGRRLLGRPLVGARWRIVDSQGQLAAINVTGDLLVQTVDGDHRTGDRARLLADGSFEHMGRSDGQIELGSRLIDPAEIGRAIEGHPAVLEAVVDVCDDASGEQRLVAYFAPRENASCTETELRARVRTAVGEHATPRLFIELDALPRDAVGDIVRARLPSPYAVSQVHDYVAPRSEGEKYVVALWKEALGVARISVYDNFFDLGGHSLLCFRVIARIESETGQRISPRWMLLNNLEQVAAQLETRAAEPVATAPSHAAASEPAPVFARTLAGRLRDRIKGIVRR
jgi:amino acid adenylation domain-containing protein